MKALFFPIIWYHSLFPALEEASTNKPLIYARESSANFCQTSARQGGECKTQTDALTLGMQINARTDFGALGNTRTFHDGSIIADSNILSSPMRPCLDSDDGASIILHGSGTSGAPQLGRVLGCTGASFKLSFNAVISTPWQGAWSASVVTAQSGSGSYAPGDKLTCVGGFNVVAPCQFVVTKTQVTWTTVASGGSGGTDGTQIVTGTTGAGARFQANVTISHGSIVSVDGLRTTGTYTLNPKVLSSEPVTGAGLSGARLAITMGILTVDSNAPGRFLSMANPNPVTTSGSGTGAVLNIAGYQAGGTFTIGTDDTAAVEAAVADAHAKKVKLYLPAGGYWLASQSSCLELDNIQVEGDGWPSDFDPVNGGTTILLSNADTPAFCGMSNVTLKDLALYYPEQDNSRAAPTPYPATFDSASFLDDTFIHIRALNTYDLFKVNTLTRGSGWGRVFFSHVMAYCVDKCFWWQSGAADTIQLDATNYWGQGAFGASAIAGPAYLSRYTEANGAFAVIDVGNASYKNVDGFLMTGGIVQGYRYGVRILSGQLDVSNFGNVNWDQVGSVLSIEGRGNVTSTSYSGGEIWSTNRWDRAQSASVFNIESTTHDTNLSIGGGIFVAYAQGSIVSDTAGGLNSLHVVGARFDHFGQTTTAGLYGAFWLTASNSQIEVVGVSSECLPDGNKKIFSFTRGREWGSFHDNISVGCNYGFFDDRSEAPSLVISGNSTYNSGVSSLYEESENSKSVIEFDNHWDKPPQPTLTSGWGAKASLTSYSDDSFVRVTIGSAPSSPALLSFNFRKSHAPICSAIDETSGVALLATATDATILVAGPKLSNDVVAISCQSVR